MKKVCHFRHVRAEMFRFRSVKYTLPLQASNKNINIFIKALIFDWLHFGEFTLIRQIRQLFPS